MVSAMTPRCIYCENTKEMGKEVITFLSYKVWLPFPKHEKENSHNTMLEKVGYFQV